MSKNRTHRGRRRVIAAVGSASLLGASLALPSAYASTNSVSLADGGAGAALVNGVLYAKSGGALTLTVTTATAVRCVQLSGASTAAQTSPTAKTSWTFLLAGLAGDATNTVTAGTRAVNNNGVCQGGTTNVGSASYKSDNTAPTLSGAPTTAPNGTNSWYTRDVSIAWTATDTGGSGVTNPANTTISGEGVDLTDSNSVADAVGNNSGSKTSNPAVKIDRTAPVTRLEAPVSTDWNNVKQTVVLVPEDNRSGVAATYYQVNDEPVREGASVEISKDGTNRLQYWSVDSAGNRETAQEATVLIDMTKPTINHTQSPVVNANGWNNSNVTVAFDCADTGGSGLKSCTGVTDGVNHGVPVTTEGTSQLVPGRAEDNAGNSVTDPARVSIDKTKPKITPVLEREPDSNGWYNADVSVDFTYSDDRSGIAEKGVSTWKFSEGANQGKSVSAKDAADNPQTGGVSGINVDNSAPTTTSDAPTGWRTSAVTVRFDADDQVGLSGVARTEYNLNGTGWSTGRSVVIGADGEHSLLFRSVDAAGNIEDATPATIRIDSALPTITDGKATTADGTATTQPDGLDGWYKTAVFNRFTAEDLGSGLADRAQASFTKSSGTDQGNAVKIKSGAVADVAGNANTGIDSAAFKIDLAAPAVTAGAAPSGANLVGWYKTAVAAPFTAADPISDLADPSKASFTVSTGTAEGPAVTVKSGPVSDVAGHSNPGVDSAAFKIDLTAPSTPIISGIVAQSYTTETVPASSAISCAAEDTLSTLDTCLIAGYANTVGSHELTATATDKAGNTSTTSLAYSVKAATVYTTEGFFAPVDMSTSTKKFVNSIKGGSTVPLKFRIFKDGVEVKDTAVTTFKVGQTSCDATATVDAVEVVTTGSTALRYDGTQWIQNWKTPTTLGCYKASVVLPDGDILFADFKVTK